MYLPFVKEGKMVLEEVESGPSCSNYSQDHGDIVGTYILSYDAYDDDVSYGCSYLVLYETPHNPSSLSRLESHLLSLSAVYVSSLFSSLVHHLNQIHLFRSIFQLASELILPFQAFLIFSLLVSVMYLLLELGQLFGLWASCRIQSESRVSFFC